MKIKLILVLFFILTQFSFSIEQTLLKNYNFISSSKYKIKSENEFYALMNNNIYLSTNQGKDWTLFYKSDTLRIYNYFVYNQKLDNNLRKFIFIESYLDGKGYNKTYQIINNGISWEEYYIHIDGIIENKETFDKIVNSNLMYSTKSNGFFDEDSYGNVYFKIGGDFLFKLSDDGTKGILQNTGISSLNYSLIGSYNENNFILSDNKFYASNHKSNDWSQFIDSIKFDNLKYLQQFDDNFLFERDSSKYIEETKSYDNFKKIYALNIITKEFKEIAEFKNLLSNGAILRLIDLTKDELKILVNYYSKYIKSYFFNYNLTSKTSDTIGTTNRRISDLFFTEKAIYISSI